ncbi:MAG: cell division protein SepF [Anaerovoracaceae bacterium]
MAEGLFGKLGSILGVTEEEYEDEEFEEEEAEAEPVAAGQNRNALYSGSSSRTRNNDFTQPKMESHGSKVVSMQNGTAGAGLQTQQTVKKQQFRLVITEPRNFNDCPRMVDSLKTRRPVIINVEHLERETARKIFDFLSGATYAINGKVQKVSDNIFVFAPENVDVLSVTGRDDSIDSRTMRDAPWRR